MMLRTADRLLIELGAAFLDERVELPSEQHLIELAIERMGRRLRQLRRGDKQGCLIVRFALSHGHDGPP